MPGGSAKTSRHGGWPACSTTSTTSAGLTTRTTRTASTPPRAFASFGRAECQNPFSRRYWDTPITPASRALSAVDELTGLITATALVRPSRSLNDVDVRSVQKKMKDKAFARGCNREDITNGAAALEIDLPEHIQFVLDAMRARADLLGFSGVTPAPA